MIDGEPALHRMIQQTNEWCLEHAWKLICPVCGFEYIHITALKCLRETDETVITSKGTLVRQASNDTRGFEITIEYHCENGHVGEIVFQFHKGCVYLTHEVLQREKAEGDIWRD